MAHLVDLTQKPYCLDAQAITWVESTIASMNLDEKLVNFLSIWDLVAQKSI